MATNLTDRDVQVLRHFTWTMPQRNEDAIHFLRHRLLIALDEIERARMTVEAARVFAIILRREGHDELADRLSTLVEVMGRPRDISPSDFGTPSGEVS